MGGKFYHLPRKAWEIICMVLIIIAIAAIICMISLYLANTFLFRVARESRLAMGIVGSVSAFLLLLAMLYGYLPKVKKFWGISSLSESLSDDPEYQEFLRQKAAREDGDTGNKTVMKVNTQDDNKNDVENNTENNTEKQ